jgi:hypothetical protein
VYVLRLTLSVADGAGVAGVAVVAVAGVAEKGTMGSLTREEKLKCGVGKMEQKWW